MHISTCSHSLHAGPANPSSSMSRMDSRLPDLGSEIRVGLTMDEKIDKWTWNLLCLALLVINQTEWNWASSSVIYCHAVEIEQVKRIRSDQARKAMFASFRHTRLGLSWSAFTQLLVYILEGFTTFIFL